MDYSSYKLGTPKGSNMKSKGETAKFLPGCKAKFGRLLEVHSNMHPREMIIRHQIIYFIDDDPP